MEQTAIDKLLASLPGARVLSPLELNEMHFSGRKSVITPSRLKRSGKKQKR